MCGETSTKQFKLHFRTAEDIANELIAFANSQGGSIFIGIDDKTGEIRGLDFRQIREIGQLISAASESRVHPSVYPSVETVLVDGKPVMIVSIEKGRDTPYTNNKREVYVKQGPDKRRVTDNNEILRLFTLSGNYQADQQGVPRTSISDIDFFSLEEFFQRSLGKSIDDLGLPLEMALQNLNILNHDGSLTLGGLMFFGKNPQRYCPAFNIKAVWFEGNSIGGTEYHDSKDIEGTIPRMFEEGMRFMESILHRRQDGQNINSIGKLEIPEVALSEILQNALTHRSWLKPAPIRLLIFDDRIEIINPGCLPNNLTVEDIKLGNAYQRNQLIANLCAKTMDYRGLGSGIIRALKADTEIEFCNEVSGDQFRVILWRTTQKTEQGTTQKTMGEIETAQKTEQGTTQKTMGEIETTQKTEQGTTQKTIGEIETTQKTEQGTTQKAMGEIETTQKTEQDTTQKILFLIKANPKISRKEMAIACGVSSDAIKLQIRKLRETGQIRRVGPDKGGYWEICQP